MLRAMIYTKAKQEGQNTPSVKNMEKEKSLLIQQQTVKEAEINDQAYKAKMQVTATYVGMGWAPLGRFAIFIAALIFVPGGVASLIRRKRLGR